MPSGTGDTQTHVLILADGERPSEELLARLVAEADLFVATDGAANALAVSGPPPHVVLGDFDSLAPSARARLPQAEFVSADDQEACDLDKAVAYAVGRGARRVTVAGAGGGRPDHALTAISVLLKYHAGVDIRTVDDYGETLAAAGPTEVRGAAGDTLSLVAFGSVEQVTLDGVRWPLNAEPLGPGSRGVSNEMTSDVARLDVKGGVLVVCHLRRA